MHHSTTPWTPLGRSQPRRPWLARAPWVLGAMLLTVSAYAAQTLHGTVTHVTDGDTLWVAPDDGGPPLKLRIDGMDAPEICQTGGVESREALARQVLQQRVSVRVRRHDDYGRGLAQVHLGEQDVGARMVREGQAWSYRYRNKPGPYAAQEALARQERRGVFAMAAAEPPRAFRKRHGSCHGGPA